MKPGRRRAEHRYRHDASRSFVAFQLAGIRYALPIAGVREITRPLRMVELPDPLPGIVGVAEYRGEVVPVVDLGWRLGHPPAVTSNRTKWIIAAGSNRTLALVVDSISEVFGALDEVLPAPPARAGDSAKLVAGVLDHDGLVFVLDDSIVGRLAGTVDLEGPSRPISAHPAAPRQA
jgi:purine-binding chemotaxis protein CheW